MDAYQSLFIEQNPQYVATNGIAKLQWEVSFQQYLNTLWAKYLQSFDDVKVPRVVLRYEDMVMNPVDFTKEALVYTGVVREMMLQDKNITASVHYIQVRAVSKLCLRSIEAAHTDRRRELTREVGTTRSEANDGCRCPVCVGVCVVAQSKTQAVTEPVGFGFRTLMNLDESNQLKTLRILEVYQPILRALGYYYYRERDGVPEDMKLLLKEHTAIQTVRSRVDLGLGRTALSGWVVETG